MIKIFTSGRDYRPAAFWRDLLPPNTVYVRLVIAADDDGMEAIARRYGVNDRYGETLAEAGEDDGPVLALRALRAEAGMNDPGAYLVTRVERDLNGTPLASSVLYAWRLKGADVIRLGALTVVGMGRPDHPYPVVRVVDAERADDVPVPAWMEGPATGAAPVDGLLAPPPGELGRVVRVYEKELIDGLGELLEELAVAALDIADARTTGDPREAGDRRSVKLLRLARRLGGLAGTAAVIEAALNPKS